eukprot:m.123215 g.123215  ORF g.123215 m.123215 type:complete len:298 (-) comp52149_c0_seq2:119-1012(-)
MAAEHALFAFRPAVRALAATCAPTRMLAVQVSARVYRAPCTPITVRTLSSFKDRKDKIMNSAQEKFTGLHESQKNLQKSEVRLMRDSPGVIADDFVPIPPEHRSSIVSVKGLGERWNAMKKIARATFSIGSIKRLDKEFKPIEFAEFAQTQFISAQEALARDDKTTLREIVTDTAFLALRKEFRQHTWKLESVVERPRIVHATMISLGDKKNLMAQVTVRLHLRQVRSVRVFRRYFPLTHTLASTRTLCLSPLLTLSLSVFLLVIILLADLGSTRRCWPCYQGLRDSAQECCRLFSS